MGCVQGKSHKKPTQNHQPTHSLKNKSNNQILSKQQIPNQAAPPIVLQTNNIHHYQQSNQIVNQNNSPSIQDRIRDSNNNQKSQKKIKQDQNSKSAGQWPNMYQIDAEDFQQKSPRIHVFDYEKIMGLNPI